MLPIVAVSGCGGGCPFPYIVNNFVVEPEFSCLGININSCSGPELQVENSCSETVIIGNFKIENGESFVSSNYISSSAGLVNHSFFNITSVSNHIIINGTVGNKTMKITFDAIKR